MTKVPWQIKGNNTGKHVFKVTKPREIVSVDQLVSTQTDFIAQLKGKLTNQCYKAPPSSSIIFQDLDTYIR